MSPLQKRSTRQRQKSLRFSQKRGHAHAEQRISRCARESLQLQEAKRRVRNHGVQNRIVKMVSPGFDFTFRVPLCRCMICRDQLSPMPEPFRLVV